MTTETQAPDPAPCRGGNPTCPCQDGDLCHYVDAPDGSTKSMPIPAPEGAPLTLPPPDTHCWDDDTGKDVWSYSADLVRSIVSAALAAPAPQAPAWQPIETAPKDGTRILVTAHGQYSAAYWWPAVWMPDAHNALKNPTHWMPLPAAPQTKEPTNDR